MALFSVSHLPYDATIRGALHPWAYAQGFLRYDKYRGVGNEISTKY